MDKHDVFQGISKCEFVMRQEVSREEEFRNKSRIEEMVRHDFAHELASGIIKSDKIKIERFERDSYDGRGSRVIQPYYQTKVYILTEQDLEIITSNIRNATIMESQRMQQFIRNLSVEKY